MTGEDLGAAAILLREGVPGLAALEIDDAPWNVVTDGRAEHRLDPASQHAVTGLEARIEQGRRRHDGSPGGERHGDDPTGNRRPHFRNRIRRESVGDPPARLRAAAVGTVQLEVALAGPDDLDDQAERLLEQRLERRLPAELEETPVQIPFLAIELALLLDPGKGEGVESLAHAGLAQYPPSRAKKARVLCLPPCRVTLGNRAV